MGLPFGHMRPLFFPRAGTRVMVLRMLPGWRVGLQVGWYGLIGSRVGGSEMLFLTQVYPTSGLKGSHWRVTYLIPSREYDIEIVTDKHVEEIMN